MKILVTGGLGAVGVPLTKELRRRGHEVWVCDVLHAEGPQYIRCDIGEYREVRNVMDQVDPEFVYHLAAEFGRWNGEAYYERLCRANIIGTKHILRMQEERRFRQLFTSSSEVYGDWDGVMEEEVLSQYPVRQMNDYAITKWVNEQQIMNSADRFGTETVRVRLFNTYGPGERYCEYRSVICRFIYCALHDLPYTVYLNHHRTSSYIDDTARSLANVCDPYHFKPGEVYNISGHEYHDIKNLSDMILQYLGKTDRLVRYQDIEEHNTRDKKTTSAKAIRDLDHRSTVPLAVGIPGQSSGRRRLMLVADQSNLSVVVIGTGYVGLPVALLLARAGHQVVGVDINENVVRALNQGILHIKEADLQQLMEDSAVRRNLTAQTTPCPADVFLIAVPSPLDQLKKIAELNYVRQAALSIVPHLRPGNLVILESTVPPLTCRTCVTPILEQSGLKVGVDLFLAHCPERILPGDVFEEIIHNDRVIGAADQASRDFAYRVYASFVQGQLLQTDDVTAELCKLMENTYRDVNIALANEFAALAEDLHIDALEAISLANRHPRVNILEPGIGVGGHCIPIDPWFIKEVSPANSRLIFTSRLVNDEMPDKIAAKIRRAVRGVRDPRIVAVGAAYKPNVEDIRESPALKIVKLLREDGYHVDHLDPLVPGMQYTTLSERCRDADCLTVLVEHDVVRDEIRTQGDLIRQTMRTPTILRFFTKETTGTSLAPATSAPSDITEVAV